MADENDDRFAAQPDDGRLVEAAGGDRRNYYDLLMSFGPDPAVWLCPSAHDGPGRLMGYHMNGLIITTNGLPDSAIAEPSQTLLITETGYRRLYDQAYLRPLGLKFLSGHSVASASGSRDRASAKKPIPNAKFQFRVPEVRS